MPFATVAANCDIIEYKLYCSLKKNSVNENVNRSRIYFNLCMSKENCDRHAPANMNKRISTTLILINKAQKEWPK